MKKHILYLLAVILFCTTALSCASEEDTAADHATELSIGDRLPDFTVLTNHGTTVSNQSLTGQVSLIVFFHTGCKDCQMELPVIQQFYDNHPETPLICISRAESEASIAKFWKAHQLTLPYSAQENRDVFERFAYHTIPRIYVADKEGIIRSIFTDNPLAKYEDIASAVQEAHTP